MKHTWMIVFLVCLARLGAVIGRVGALRHFRRRLMLMPAEGLGRGHAKSSALKAASSEANSDPPCKEAYWYARDTENRLANQLATGIAAVQASVEECKDLAKETSKESKEIAKESKELVEKFAKECKDLAKETSKECKELVEKFAKESKDLAKESKELVGKSVERSNLILFLGFAQLAVLVSMQPELRVFFSLFLSKLK